MRLRRSAERQNRCKSIFFVQLGVSWFECDALMQQSVAAAQFIFLYLAARCTIVQDVVLQQICAV
jgi:hypothetical protein